MSVRLMPWPIGLREANAFVAEHHRHAKPIQRNGGKWAVGAVDEGGDLWGVVIVGSPVSRVLAAKGERTAEVRRLCVRDGAPRNCGSFLYARAWQVWQAMGGAELITYTLQSESGASLRGAGYRVVAKVAGHPKGWLRPACHRRREWQGLYAEPKLRWERS